MTLKGVSVRFVFEPSQSKGTVNEDLDNLLITYLSSVSAKSRHNWIMSAMRVSALMVLSGSKPQNHLLSDEERARFRQLGNMLRTMGFDEDFVRALGEESQSLKEGFEPPVNEPPASTKSDRPTAPPPIEVVVPAVKSVSTVEQVSSVRSGEVGEPAAPAAGLSPLKQRLKNL